LRTGPIYRVGKVGFIFAAAVSERSPEHGDDDVEDTERTGRVCQGCGRARVLPLLLQTDDREYEDDDGDGVNNCDDKCPDSQAGQTIGPDGCPVPVSIDLKGVNFDFDRSELRPDAVAILNEAVQILQRYPELRVEVAGHTDLCGTDAYNQSLSERRASAVYDYLSSNGIDASRMVGPNGYGESRPLEPTAQTLPECKNERNRRTELNVQN